MRQLMNLVTGIFIAAGAMASISVWAALPMKPGLWEIQPKIQLRSENGTMPVPDISQLMQNMSPQMRNQMEAIMQKQGVSMGDDGNLQVCTTQDMIARNRLPQNKGCESLVTKTSGNKYSFHFSCGTPPTTGEGDVVFQNSEAYTSRVKITRQDQGEGRSVTMESSAKWIGADCGNLKPPGN
ncbi:MAG: DUF3617 domain-containing protein [Betaproteobacteria bacterium]|nr:DUF3617 domain-containing protein [Betaproteobacteria bacterium]